MVLFTLYSMFSKILENWHQKKKNSKWNFWEKIVTKHEKQYEWKMNLQSGKVNFRSLIFPIIFKGSLYKSSQALNFEKPLFVNHTVHVSKNCNVSTQKSAPKCNIVESFWRPFLTASCINIRTLKRKVCLNLNFFSWYFLDLNPMQSSETYN